MYNLILLFSLAVNATEFNFSFLTKSIVLFATVPKTWNALVSPCVAVPNISVLPVSLSAKANKTDFGSSANVPSSMPNVPSNISN